MKVVMLKGELRIVPDEHSGKIIFMGTREECEDAMAGKIEGHVTSKEDLLEIKRLRKKLRTYLGLMGHRHPHFEAISRRIRHLQGFRYKGI